MKDAMTREVKTILSTATLDTAMDVLRQNHISGLPVVDGAFHVVGVLSEKDISRALSEALGRSEMGFVDVLLHTTQPSKGPKRRTGGAGADTLDIIRQVLTNVRVGDVMNQDPVVVTPDATLDVAAGIMSEHNINRLPVVTRGKLVGILTRHDVLSAWV